MTRSTLSQAFRFRFPVHIVTSLDMKPRTTFLARAGENKQRNETEERSAAVLAVAGPMHCDDQNSSLHPTDLTIHNNNTSPPGESSGHEVARLVPSRAPSFAKMVLSSLPRLDGVATTWDYATYSFSGLSASDSKNVYCIDQIFDSILEGYQTPNKIF
ncbi:predicted protein [Histoplasma capsulatum var. duboisii H88]|uniref:Predicted protein n=1 Tax=Ajellomyces capsulatus (strain H88) TaxID=544711 RepID=F0UCB9_AJEC8|nr:predicted protein [Histoplasma capsulatum var. duboisii H88]